MRCCLQKALLPIGQTVAPLRERPILELDELWSFVGNKKQKVWVWLALERQTRRIVGFALGDRSAKTCEKVWFALSPDYRKRAVCYTDFGDAYSAVLPSKRHLAVGKETGQTAHTERFNNTLRQCCANLVRDTLSFSRKLEFHEIRIRLFIDHYNVQLERHLMLPVQ